MVYESCKTGIVEAEYLWDGIDYASCSEVSSFL